MNKDFIYRLTHPLSKNPLSGTDINTKIAPGPSQFLVTPDGKFLLTPDGKYLTT